MHCREFRNKDIVSLRLCKKERGGKQIEAERGGEVLSGGAGGDEHEAEAEHEDEGRRTRTGRKKPGAES